MVKKAYLIQTGQINKPYNTYKGLKLSEAVCLDAMDSAEFEFGALPKSLRRMEATKVFKLDTIEFRNQIYKGIDISQVVRVFHSLTSEQFEKYIEESLKPMFFRKLHLKENSRFGEDSVSFNGRRSKVDFWWDIENDVMWSADKMFMNRLPKHLEASWAYMNKNK